jgi:hypothetical protein
MKYRSEMLFGTGYRDAAAVMAHEVFELQNTDIPYTLSRTILKGTAYGNKLEILEEELNNDYVADGDENGELYDLICNAYEDKNLGVSFFKDVLEEIKNVTGKDIKYCIWLCDSKEDVCRYDLDGTLSNDDIDAYEESNVILSDIANEGKLYGYEECPKPLNV